MKIETFVVLTWCCWRTSIPGWEVVYPVPPEVCPRLLDATAPGDVTAPDVTTPDGPDAPAPDPWAPPAPLPGGSSLCPRSSTTNQITGYKSCLQDRERGEGGLSLTKPSLVLTLGLLGHNGAGKTEEKLHNIENEKYSKKINWMWKNKIIYIKL